MRKIAVACCIAVASISVCRADDGPGTYFAPEAGTANVVVQPMANPNAKIRKTVAFLGGSITEMHGYRPRVMAALRKKYPDVDFMEIAAGISSTCSDTGAFRLAEDVLAKGSPDLFFVEESVNDDQDGHFYRVHAIRGMEGIVRRVREKCPRCKIVIGLMVNRSQYEVRMSGKTPMICEAHVEVARHYGAAIADVGAALAASATAGGFSWTEYRDCHPSPAGCDFAANVIMNTIDAAFNPYAEAKVNALPTPLDENSYFHGTVVPFASVRIDSGWNVSQPDWGNVPGSKREQFVHGDALWSETPGAEFSFSFRGTAAAAILTSGPDVGAVEVSVDGGEWRRVELVSPYSRTLNYPHTKFFADGLPDAVHEIRVRLVEALHEWGGGKAVRINRLVVNGVVVRPETTCARPAPSPALAARLANGPEIYGIVHWGLNTYTDREWGFGDEDPAMLNPDRFDADQIVGACKAGGIGGLIIVAKHHDGFCLWPTKTTEHNITKSPFWKSWSPKLELEKEKIPLSNSNSKLELKGKTGRDYVKEMEQACRRAGLKFGVYVSPWDRNNAAYGTDKYVTDVFQNQIRELLSGGYGEIFEMWFDGANGGDGWYGGARVKRKIPSGYYRYDTETFAMVRKLQPKVCIFNEMDEADFRFGGNERGTVDPDSRSTIGHYDGIWDNYKHVANVGVVNGTTFHPIEADFPLRRGWFYHEKERGTTKSAAYLMKLYLSSVGNAATMNIGIAPDKSGRLDADDVRALAGFGVMRNALFAQEVKECEPFNVVVMREDVSNGEQVDEWEFVADGKAILRGKSIGWKRIRVLETPCSAKHCELNVLKDGGALKGVSFSLYNADPELVNTVLNAAGDDRETDTAKWMTTKQK